MSLADTSPFDTLTGQPLASQQFVNSILGPGIVGWIVQVGALPAPYLSGTTVFDAASSIQILLFGVLLTSFVTYVTSEAFAREGARLKAFLCIVVLLCTFKSA